MLKDNFGRNIDYLRVSVTDRCDLRCIFCMPPEGVGQTGHSDILRFEEIEAAVRAGAELGIKNVRLTGGEPLARSGIVELAKKLASIPGVADLAMTTNGVLFPKFGRALREAGLGRVNFGISSLDPATYGRITRRGSVMEALEGLDCAIKLGFAPIKLNVVVMKGINDDLTGFVALAAEKQIQVRFIEYMPIGPADHASLFLPAPEICKRIEAVAKLEPIEGCKGNGPANRAWRTPNGKGSITVIAPMTEHVCDRCNRLRLTADGHLRPCLFSKGEISLKPALRPAADAGLLKSLYLDAVAKKPESLHKATGFGRGMSQIGG